MSCWECLCKILIGYDLGWAKKHETYDHKNI